MYRIKEEFLDLWTVYDGQGDIVDLEEIKWLAKEWDKPLEELLDQVEEVEDTQEEMKMTKELIERMNKAINRIGGPLAVLNLPVEVKEVIADCHDYETRVKMLELVCEQLGK